MPSGSCKRRFGPVVSNLYGAAPSHSKGSYTTIYENFILFPA